MINWYKKYKKNQAKKAEAVEVIRLTNLRLERERTTELKAELYTQSLQNVTFIKSTIQTLMSGINSIKTRGSEKNKIRKEFMQEQLAWFKTKLEEEQGMVEYYGVNIK